MSCWPQKPFYSFFEGFVPETKTGVVLTKGAWLEKGIGVKTQQLARIR